MSAFYAVTINDDRIDLLTDGAIYDDNGTLLDIRQKVWTSPTVPFAVTGRGEAKAVYLIAQGFLAFSLMGSVDRALDAIAEALAERRAREDGSDPANHCEMVIAAISETRGPVIYYMATTNAHGIPDFEPLKLYSWGGEIGGGTELTPEEVAGIRSSVEWDPDRGLANIAVPLFEAMRSKKGKNPARPDLPEHYGIGGHIDMTVVSSAGASTVRIHEWPDEIGKPIDPFGAERLAA